MSKDPPPTVPLARDAETPYELIEEVGAGGMGTVFRAKDRVTGRTLAVKVMREQSGDISRFALESSILEKLRHPAIVEYAYHGLTRDGHPYLAIEWLDGDTLEHRLRSGTLSVAESVRIARVLAGALAAAHAAGVIHRDLKPSNVFLGRGEEVKLIDFGVAKSREAQLTRTGDALGTPGYMAPEQARGAKVDARSDLFSLGCVLFRCLAGRRPFGGGDLLEYATNLALATAPRLRSLTLDVPESLDELVSRLLAKDPEGRPDSAEKVAEDLARIENGEPLSEVAPTVTVSPRPDGTAPTAISPVASGGSSLPTKARSNLVPILVGAALVVFGGTFAASRLRTTSAREAAPTVTSATSATTRSDDRAVMDRACRVWGAAIAKGQRPDGGFSGEQHRAPSGWDTAQQLFALAEAKRACGVVGPTPLLAGAKALAAFRVGDGIPSLDLTDKRGRTPATAWAILAVEATAREVPDDPSLPKLAALLRTDLLRGRNDDGGFRHLPSDGTARSSLYATIMAAWALERAPEGKPARAWLRNQVKSGAATTKVLGITEHLAWLLSRTENEDSTTTRPLVAEIEAHCRFDASTRRCARPAFETGAIALMDAAKSDLVTLWHPWLLLASSTLATKGDGDRMAPIAHFAATELAVAIDALAAAPEYKIAEYLIAVSEALGR